MSKWRDRMQGYEQAGRKQPRGFRRRDMRGNLIDDGTGFNPSAAAMPGSGGGRASELRPQFEPEKALAERGQGIVPPPDLSGYRGAREPFWWNGGRQPYAGGGHVGDFLDRSGKDIYREPIDPFGEAPSRMPGLPPGFLGDTDRPPSIPDSAVHLGGGDYYVPGKGKTRGDGVYQLVHMPQYERGQQASADGQAPEAQPIRRHIKSAAPAAAPAKPAAPPQPNALGGGLSRWYALNPNAAPKGVHANAGLRKPVRPKPKPATSSLMERNFPL